MDYDQFNTFCRELPATSYVMQWGGSHVWKVGGKVFAVGGWQAVDGHNGEPAFTFKTSDNHFNILQDEPGYRPAPYMAARGMKWIQRYQGKDNDEQLSYYLTESHRIVSLGLSKKLQRELGLNQQ